MDSDQQEQQQTTQPQSIPGGEGVEKERTTPQMNRFRLSNDAEGEDSPKKSFAFWQSQEQDAIRSRSSSLSRTPNQMGRSPSFSSKVKVIDPQQVAALLDSTNSTTSTTSLTSSLNTSTHAKDQEQRFNKLASLTGRKDSLASLQPYLNPKTQEEASAMGNKIIQSDKLKQIYGARPPTHTVSSSSLGPTEKEKEKSIEKLGRLTGRSDSLNDISEFLKAKNAEEAKEMGKQIEKSDKLKRVFGARPKSPGSDDEPAQSPTSPNSEVENITTSRASPQVTPENVTAVITDIIKENQELKLRTSTLSDRMNEEVERRRKAEIEKAEMQAELERMKQQLASLQNKSD